MIHYEHLPLVQGKGRYLDDLAPTRAAHAAFVRSPYAHANILSIDTEAARATAGVHAIFTAKDVRDGIRPIVPHLETNERSCYFETQWWPIVGEVVRYVGEIVALVVADDRYIAEDAAALIEVDYEFKAPVANVTAAKRTDAPRLHPELPSNLLYENHLGPATLRPGLSMPLGAAARDPFETAPVVVKVICRHGRLAGLAIENCGVIAQVDAGSGRLEVWTSTQVPHLIRDGLSTCLLRPAESIRVIAPDVGGAFGVKMHLFPEEVLVSYAATQLDTPVKWVQDRAENLLASFHARELSIEGELAAERDGTVLGLRARLACDVGAYSAFPVTSSLEPQTIGGALPGPYRLPFYEFTGQAYATNKFPTGAYRGVGFPVGPLVTESLMDSLARAVGLDPVDVRKLNLLGPAELPHENALGTLYDSGNYPALLSLAVDHIDYPRWRMRQASARETSHRIGIGVSCFIESTGMGESVYRRRGMTHIPGFDAARIRVNADGTVTAMVSTPSQGQGQGTTFRCLLGQLMEIDESAIEIVLGDTDSTPYGSGTFASRSVVSGGGALSAAVGQLIPLLEARAALLWQIDPAAVRYRRGVVTRLDDDRPGFTLPDLARASAQEPDAVGLEALARFSVPSVPFACATHITTVEVDVDTGAVKLLRYVVAEDCGPIINQAAVDGQVRGAVAQGIGSALLEQHVYDGEAQPLTGTLQDYLVPGTLDVPEIEILHLETPSPFTPGGHKGVGESGIIGAPAAIANAVADALDLAPSTVTLPLTPERVRALIGAGS